MGRRTKFSGGLIISFLQTLENKGERRYLANFKATSRQSKALDWNFFGLTTYFNIRLREKEREREKKERERYI